MRRQVHGILLLDKPPGITSNGALQKVKRLFNAKKAGHTGSLDPIATGMLPICFGEATKFSQFLLDSDKVYDVVAKLGIRTTTGDIEGTIIETKPVDKITTTRLEEIMQTYLGEIKQIPPMFSAIKIDGKPLYELARRGIEVEREPRKITIFSLQLQSHNLDEIVFRVHCSKGTYIRTLVEDIGRELGSCAHVTQLRRIMVAPYSSYLETGMHTLPALQAMADGKGKEELYACLLPVETSVQSYPAVQLSMEAAFYLRMGQPVRTAFPSGWTMVRLMSEEKKFLGMGEVMQDGRVKPYRLIA